MKQLTENVSNEDGYRLHIIPHQKHKTVAFVGKWKAPLTRETITKRALLTQILKQGTETYPTRAKLGAKLNDLYGAVLSIDSSKKGDNHIISIRLEVANDKFIPETSEIINEALTLLHELLLVPHNDGQAFPKDKINREKATLKQKMHAVVDDKMRYANMRLIDEMCADDVYHLHIQGYEEDLASITPESLYQYYNEMIEEDELDIYVSGDVEPDDIHDKITARIRRQKLKTHANETVIDTSKNIEPQTVIEEQSVQQAKLHFGFRTRTRYADPDYFALQVFNGVFGGFPSSKLFLNVREKNSLAYYAASRFESHQGLLFVQSGISPNDYEQAREIIELQLSDMKKGEFTEADIQETKGLIINQLRETLDNQQGIIELLYQQVVANYTLTPEELIDGINRVTKEAIIDVAQKVELDTVYLLTNGGNRNE